MDADSGNAGAALDDDKCNKELKYEEYH